MISCEFCLFAATFRQCQKGCDFFDNFLVLKYNNQYLSRTKLKGKYGGG